MIEIHFSNLISVFSFLEYSFGFFYFIEMKNIRSSLLRTYLVNNPSLNSRHHWKAVWLGVSVRIVFSHIFLVVRDCELANRFRQIVSLRRIHYTRM